jgi:hypothetical protein
MDYVTRQFINLTKKLRDDLRKGLSLLHNDLKHGIKAVNDQTKARDEADQVQPPSPILHAELHIPEAIKTESKADSDRNYSLQKWIAIGTWLAFFSVSIYAYLTLREWREMIYARHQAQGAVEAAIRTARDADISLASQQKLFAIEQRPYLVLNCCQGEKPTPGNPIIANIGIKNIGKTPALHVEDNFHLVTGKQIAEIHSEPVHPEKQETTIPQNPEGIFVTLVTTDKDIYTFDPSAAPPSGFANWNGEFPIIVFGRTTYEDSFGTKYCTPAIYLWLHDSLWGRPGNISLNLPKRHKFPAMCPPGMSQ